MKKINILLLLATVFSAIFCMSCSQDDAGFAPEVANAEKKPHFFGIKSPDQAGIAQTGVAQKDKLWYNGTAIKVMFLNGTTADKEKVKTYAKEWETYANITFNFIESGDAHVRVGFDWNQDRYVTWSYVGTDCKINTDKDDATLSFADFAYLTEAEKKGEVLRAFGTVLGLELEHRNLNFVPNWRTPTAAQNYWTLSSIADLDWGTLRKYVFDPLEAANVIQTTEYDQLSIMVWPFPATVLRNASPQNYTLSAKDIEFIKQLYPKKKGYYNGYEHDLPEPNWEKLKTINGAIGAARDIDGNYYFYPYHSGNIVKYNNQLTDSKVLGYSISDDYRLNPRVVPTPNGNILMRKSYTVNDKLSCVNIDNPSSEYHTTISKITASYGGFTFDYDREALYHYYYVYAKYMTKI